MSERDVFIAMLEATENKSKEVKPSWDKRLSVNSAKKIAKNYNLGHYLGYSARDGYFYFEDGRVGDCTPSRTEVRPDCGQDVNINLNDKNLKFVKHIKFVK